MTITAFLLRVIRRIGIFNRASQSIVRRKVAKEGSRKRLNRWYNRRNSDEQAIFQNLYCKIFTKEKKKIAEGTWRINFKGKELVLPLRNEYSWLDWDNAISIVGHDPDVKTTYSNLLANDPGIRIFFDIGANYGTHSLLFLSHGINVVSFEPNTGLKKQFDLFCDLNNVRGNMEGYAIGDKTGSVDFWYPENASWLGTIVAEAADSLKGHHNLQKRTVPLITLDGYTEEKGIQPDLVKIDTEGNEINVLKGATRLFDTRKPLVIFESNTQEGRDALWNFFQEKGYTIYDLPFGASNDRTLPKESFFTSASFNFIAVPANYFQQPGRKASTRPIHAEQT